MAASGYTGNPPGSGGGGGGTTAWVDITGKPATFPPSAHTQAASTISDSTTVGRAVLTAVDAAAARTAIAALAAAGGTVTGTLVVDGVLRVGTSVTLEIGPDTNLYRASANHLATDDSLAVGGDLLVYGNVDLQGIITGVDVTDVTGLTAALAAKADLASPTFAGTVSGITATMVGLGNVTNTSDANKPVSTAQQTALNLKASLASPTFTGTVAGITATMVGLGNVTNTSDANKPVSTAQATAIALKADLASPTFTGTPAAPTAAPGTNTTQLASTAYVTAAVAAGGGGGGTAATFVRARITSGDITVPTDAAFTPVTGLTLALPAVTGDDVELSLNCMIDMTSGGTDFFDLVILVAGAIVRTSSTGTATSALEGDPAMYPGSRFRGQSVTWSLTLVSGDISGGNVTFGLAHKGGSGSAKVFASTTYPFRWNARNDH